MEQSCTYTEKHARDGDKDTSKAKALLPTISYYFQALTQFLLIRTRRHNIHSKEKENATLKR